MWPFGNEVAQRAGNLVVRKKQALLYQNLDREKRVGTPGFSKPLAVNDNGGEGGIRTALAFDNQKLR